MHFAKIQFHSQGCVILQISLTQRILHVTFEREQNLCLQLFNKIVYKNNILLFLFRYVNLLLKQQNVSCNISYLFSEVVICLF